jgi:hypothetical protein
MISLTETISKKPKTREKFETRIQMMSYYLSKLSFILSQIKLNLNERTNETSSSRMKSMFESSLESCYNVSEK